MPPLNRPAFPSPSTARTKLADIARDAGVSIATASRALSRPELVSRDTREAVEAAAARADYRPNLAARSLRTQSTASVYVLVQSLDSPACAELLRGFDWTAHEHGYSLMLGVTGYDRPRRTAYLDSAVRQRTDGLLILDGLLDAATPRGLFAGIPAVQVLERHPSLGLPSVTVDDRAAAKAATAHLTGLGHRQIGHLSGPPEASATALRMDGYRAALIDAGIPFDPEKMMLGGASFASAMAAVSRLMSRFPQTTALFCGTDLMATAAMQWASLNGLQVPRDLSVVGFDGLEPPQGPYPPLTTVRVPRFDVGAQAMRLLLNLIAGVAVNEPHKVVPAELVIRASAAAAPA